MLKPRWQDAEAATAPALRQRGSISKIHDPVAEKDAVAVEKLSRSAAPNIIKEISGEGEAVSYGRRERYQADSVRQAALFKAGLVWIDGAGDVIVYDRQKREAARISPPMGPAQKWAVSQDGRFVYGLAGGFLQRWDLDVNEAAVAR